MRVSTNDQDLAAQKNSLAALGVTSENTFTDQGLTGANRARPGLREALAACRAGDTLVVTKPDRLARSLRDAKDIVDELTRREVKLSIGGSVHDPTDPVGRLLFNVLAMVAEFEADLIRARTREGMPVAKAKGHLRGKQPKLSKTQEAHPGLRSPGGDTQRWRLPNSSRWPAQPSTAPSSAPATPPSRTDRCSHQKPESAPSPLNVNFRTDPQTPRRRRDDHRHQRPDRRRIHHRLGARRTAAELHYGSAAMPPARSLAGDR